MEMSDAIQRIIRPHIALLLAALILGVGVAAAIGAGERQTYRASNRIVTGADEPRGAAESNAIADAARAIVTSPGTVTEALADAGVQRDAVRFAADNVDVRAIGTSGVLELGVTDTDPTAATRVSDALAAQLVAKRRAISAGQLPQVLEELNEQIVAANRQVARLEARVQRPANPQVQQVRMQAYGQAVQERAELEAQRRRLLEAQALRGSPTIVDSTPAQPLSKQQASDLALGGLLGLIVGLTFAVILESVRPTIVGARSIARALNAPTIASLPRPPHDLGRRVIAPVGERVRLAAARAGVDTVELIGVGSEQDTARTADALEIGAGGGDGHGALRIVPQVNGNGTSSIGSRAKVGIAVLTPELISRSELDPITDLQAVTGWPVLGVITYPRHARRKSGRDDLPETHDARKRSRSSRARAADEQQDEVEAASA